MSETLINKIYQLELTKYGIKPVFRILEADEKKKKKLRNEQFTRRLFPLHSFYFCPTVTTPVLKIKPRLRQKKKKKTHFVIVVILSMIMHNNNIIYLPPQMFLLHPYGPLPVDRPTVARGLTAVRFQNIFVYMDYLMFLQTRHYS